MKKRFIQIGLGGFGEYWCTDVLPYITRELGTAEMVAAADINPASFVNAVEYVGLSIDKCYTDARKAMEENEADFVNIVVPPAYHEQMIDLALEFGCDILCEKPIAGTMEDCCRIYQKVKAKGKKMAVTVSHRFDQPPQTMEKLLRDETYGRLTHISSRFAETYLNRLPEGNFRYDMEDEYLLEWGIHHLDMLRALSGSNAKTVYTKTWSPPWSALKSDTSCAVTIEMENGVHCLYEGIQENATRLNTWQDEYFRAECEFGTVVMDHQKVNVIRSTDLQSEEVIHIPLLKRRAWLHAWLIEMFVEWLDGGEEPPNNLDDNLQCCALLFAAIESAHTGLPVDVQKFLETYTQGAHRNACPSGGSAAKPQINVYPKGTP